MTLKVIDVASYQSIADVTSYGADACIVKATQGTTYVNPKCNAQFAKASQAGMKLGLYHYASGGDPIAEADYFLASIGNYVKQGILALDWEQGDNAAWGKTNWCRQFVDRVHDKTGVWCLIYTGQAGSAQAANCAHDCALWYANYPDRRNSWDIPDWPLHPTGWSVVSIWQFSDSGGRIDRSIAYMDAKAWDTLAQGGQAPKPTTKVNITYALRLSNGQWLPAVTNANDYAGLPSHEHDLLMVKVDHGSVRYQVHTAQSGWLGWVTGYNPNDLDNGCAGVPGQAIDAVQIYYNTPSGETAQCAFYRSQTTKRSGWLPVVTDDQDYAGIFGEPLDHLQTQVCRSTPF